MPKVKTNRAAAKRFSATASGKIRRRHAYLRHILGKKQRKTKRHLRKPALLGPGDARRVRRLLPHLM